MEKQDKQVGAHSFFMYNLIMDNRDLPEITSLRLINQNNENRIFKLLEPCVEILPNIELNTCHTIIPNIALSRAAGW